MIGVLYNGRIVTPETTLEAGWLAFDGGQIVDIGVGRPPTGGSSRDVDGGWVLPGFIDMHVHGGNGLFAQNAEPSEIVEIAEFHRTHGTTSMVLSVVADEADQMERAVAAIAVEAGRPSSTVVGSHLEGPFLSPARSGAIRPEALRPPQGPELERLLLAGAGTVRQVTIAPELPGAMGLIDLVTGAGSAAAIGHSNADAITALEAIAAGSRIATHLFNAMSGVQHRAPGVATACLISPDVTCEIVLDGHHLAPEIARLAFAAAGAGRIALVTDAMAAAGLTDGTYFLAGQELSVVDGVARTQAGALAGSTLTMDAAFRYAVTVLELSVEAASNSASSVPAAAIGLAGVTGSLRIGLAADIVLLDTELHVVDTYVRGGAHELDALARS